MRAAHLWVAGVRVVTDVFWEDRADECLHLLRVNVGRMAPSFLLHTHIVKDLQTKKRYRDKKVLYFIILPSFGKDVKATCHDLVYNCFKIPNTSIHFTFVCMIM